MNIRNGENGLESEKSGLVFNEGDHVNYDKTYQKMVIHGSRILVKVVKDIQ